MKGNRYTGVKYNNYEFTVEHGKLSEIVKSDTLDTNNLRINFLAI